MGSEKKLALVLTVLIALVGSGVSAIWLSGFRGDITGSVTSGIQQDLIVDEWNVSSATQGDYINNFSYFNGDGTIDMDFYCTDNTVSSDNNCNWEVDTDAILYVYNGVGYELCTNNPTLTLTPGNNTISVKISFSEYRCPSDNLNMTVSGLI